MNDHGLGVADVVQVLHALRDVDHPVQPVLTRVDALLSVQHLLVHLGGGRGGVNEAGGGASACVDLRAKGNALTPSYGIQTHSAVLPWGSMRELGGLAWEG